MPKHWIYWIHYHSDHILWFTPLYDTLPGAGPRRQDPQRIQGDSDQVHTKCRNPWILQDAWSCFVGLDIQAKLRPNTSKKTDRQVYYQSPSVATAPWIFVEFRIINVGSAHPASAPTSSMIRLMQLIMRVTEMVHRRYINHARLSMRISVWLRTVSFICITAMW